MSLAYLDPGNLESSLQLGSYTNFQLVWVLWWATVMGLVLQEMSARIGLVTGKDLAQLVRGVSCCTSQCDLAGRPETLRVRFSLTASCVAQEYPRWLNYVIYAMMEVAVIGADIQEVVGSGIAINLLTGLDIWVGCLITGFDTFTFLIVQYVAAARARTQANARNSLTRCCSAISAAATSQCRPEQIRPALAGMRACAILRR